MVGVRERPPVTRGNKSGILLKRNKGRVYAVVYVMEACKDRDKWRFFCLGYISLIGVSRGNGHLRYR